MMVAAVTPTTDIVQGYKIGRGDPWYRKIIGRVYHHVVKLAFGLHQSRHRLRLPPVPTVAVRRARRCSRRRA